MFFIISTKNYISLKQILFSGENFFIELKNHICINDCYPTQFLFFLLPSTLLLYLWSSHRSMNIQEARSLFLEQAFTYVHCPIFHYTVLSEIKHERITSWRHNSLSPRRDCVYYFFIDLWVIHPAAFSCSCLPTSSDFLYFDDRSFSFFSDVKRQHGSIK